MLTFKDERFINENLEFGGADEDEYDFTDHVTHWAQLEPLNWNDGLPLHRSCIQ